MLLLYERRAREQIEGERTGQLEEGNEGKVSQRSDCGSEKIKWRPLERSGRTLTRSSREMWVRRRKLCESGAEEDERGLVK